MPPTVIPCKVNNRLLQSSECNSADFLMLQLEVFDIFLEILFSNLINTFERHSNRQVPFVVDINPVSFCLITVKDCV